MTTTKTTTKTPEKKSSIIKTIGVLTAIVVALSSFAGAYQDLLYKMKHKKEETDFVLQKIIEENNARIIRLETFLELARARGAFKDITLSDFEMMEYRVKSGIAKNSNPYGGITLAPSSTYYDKIISNNTNPMETKLSPKELANKKKELNLKSLDDYKEEFRVEQQTSQNR